MSRGIALCLVLVAVIAWLPLLADCAEFAGLLMADALSQGVRLGGIFLAISVAAAPLAVFAGLYLAIRKLFRSGQYSVASMVAVVSAVTVAAAYWWLTSLAL